MGLDSAYQRPNRFGWAYLLAEPLLASTALERLTHRARFVENTGAICRPLRSLTRSRAVFLLKVVR